jgi:hypothetical protein
MKKKIIKKFKYRKMMKYLNYQNNLEDSLNNIYEKLNKKIENISNEKNNE